MYTNKGAPQGNAYVYSAPKQPYVFPCKVFEFQESIAHDLISQQNFQSQTSVNEEMGELQGRLTRVLNRSSSGGDDNRTVGSFSREIYQYFMEREISLPFADANNRWIGFEHAQSLYLQLRSQAEDNE
jgi:hypothetical protein